METPSGNASGSMLAAGKTMAAGASPVAAKTAANSAKTAATTAIAVPVLFAKRLIKEPPSAVSEIEYMFEAGIGNRPVIEQRRKIGHPDRQKQAVAVKTGARQARDHLAGQIALLHS